MPGTDVFFYQDSDGHVPVQAWLDQLQRRNRRAFARCYQRIERLAECGHELRRPEADFLRDGIYELRAREGNVQYRILYFFHGQSAAILAHALTKEQEVPAEAIELAVHRKLMLMRDPKSHTFVPEEEEAP